MSTFRRSTVGSLTRGGQTTIQYLRMIWEVIRQFTAACAFMLSILIGGIFILRSDDYERYVAFRWAMAKVVVDGLRKPDLVVEFQLPSGKTSKVYTSSLVSNRAIIGIINELYADLVHAMVYALFATIAALAAGVKFIYKTGSMQIKDEFVRGGQLLPVKELRRLIKAREPVGLIPMGGINLPVSVEPAHVVICGSPGTGKSILFMDALRALRAAGLRVVVYDITGDFVKKFYRQGKDILLNPLDARTADWDIWCDANAEWDYDTIAHSLVPDSAMGKDPMWALAVRIVFAEIAKNVYRDGKPSTKKLLKYLLEVSKEEVIAYIQDTDAAAILDEDGERVVTSIRTMLATYTKPFRYLAEASSGGFSIREWVKGKEDGSWIFITTKEEQKEAVKPLITVWLDIAASAILSLSPDRRRRLWQVLDEIPTLNRLPSLINTLTNSRKYGGSFMLGFQNYPQLKAVYGKDGADALIEACSTLVILRPNGEETGAWASKALGTKEVLETTEGISYGVTDLRDGVTLNRTKKPETIVLSTELNNLPDLHGFIRLGRGYPIGKFILTHLNLPDIAIDFIGQTPTSTAHDKYVGGQFYRELLPESDIEVQGSKSESESKGETVKPIADYRNL
jgi:type IV conjugative transfer system coupling protein TraD